MGCLNSCISESQADDLFEHEATLSGEFAWKVYAISSSALRVVWAEPSGLYFHYKVRYRRAHHGLLERWRKVRIHHNRTVQLTNMHADTQYEISLKDKTKSKARQLWLPSKFCYTFNDRDRAKTDPKAPLLDSQNT